MGPTFTLIRPEMTSPSTASMVAPGMQGATCSTSSSTSQACSGGTGMVNECSSSISSDSRRCRQCSAGQHASQVAPVIGCAVQVGGRLRFGVGELGGRPQGAAARLGPGGGLFRRAGPDGDSAHVGQPYPGLGDVPIGPPGQRGHADDRPRLGGPVELLVVVTPVRAELGHPEAGEYLAG